MGRHASRVRAKRTTHPDLLPMLALLVILLPRAAEPSAMRVSDLGPVASRVGCLETAAIVIKAYIAEFGGFATSGDPKNPEEWAIYGWGLKPGTNDVVIACPTVAGQVNALLTVHASGDAAAEDADTVAAQIRDLWSLHR